MDQDRVYFEGLSLSGGFIHSRQTKRSRVNPRHNKSLCPPGVSDTCPNLKQL
jgi:hypothetical protein